jgi:UTP-glucose-1-phosphate uridylyltransferase
MKKIIKLTESELVKIVNKVILEQKVDEGIFDGIKNAYRGLKGMKRGFGTDYFQNMSRLENLIKKLKNLDVPNEKVMNELEKLKTKVSSLGMPQARKDALITLIDNSLYHFKKYSNVNDQILTQIKTLNLDSWK